jgi:hypothetical protein
MYHSPAMNCCACGGVSFAWPVIGLDTGSPFLVNQINTEAFLSGPAGPWKWAIVAELDKPL